MLQKKSKNKINYIYNMEKTCLWKTYAKYKKKCLYSYIIWSLNIFPMKQ